MKKCSKCGETKEITAFSKNKRAKDGRQGYCKTCAYEKTKKWHTENKEAIKDYQKVYRNKNKEKLRQYHKDYRANATPCVYRIKHKQDGRYYLGQTTRPLCERLSLHFSSKCCVSSPFTGLNKDDWFVEALCYGTKKQVKHFEKVLLDKRVGIDAKCLNKNK